MSVRAGKLPQVKNRAPAPVQVTAEQLLREAKERIEAEPRQPRQRITDMDELEDYRMRKRKEFEDRIRRQREHIGGWIKYAKWEETQKCFDRARSIFERVLDVDYRNPAIWRQYAEMEMRNKFANHARNVFDRAVSLLPRVDQLWYRYTYMEEMLGNVAAAREVFERWMKWEPNDHAWLSYIKLETRAGELDRARAIYERYVQCHPTQVAYTRWAKWEEQQLQPALARQVFTDAFGALPETEKDEHVYIAFAKFEERCREYERARVVYKFGLDALGREQCPELYREYVAFEKQHGDREGIEEAIIDKRRQQYEAELAADARNYDVWFDYARLEESHGDVARVREVYERAIANVPPAQEKRFWKRYIFLWIYYAVFEEMTAEDAERAREVYKACLQLIPHKAFTFARVWTMYAHFEVRQKDLQAARKALGMAVGMCSTEKVFKAYIQLELQLGNIDRCRTLYEKYLQFQPFNCAAWTKFAALEQSVGEVDRARAIFELAINQPLLDTPEVLWKAYVDFETSNEEHDRVRMLYERLLERTKHVKVFISFAKFEASVGEADNARAVFQRAYDFMKAEGLQDERVVLLEAWLAFESQLPNNAAHAKEVQQKMPRRVKKKRLVQAEDGSQAGWEEYYDYIFPDDQQAQSSLKILQMAHLWKKRKAAESGVADAEEGEEPAAKRMATGGAAADAAAAAADEAEINLEDM